MPDGAIGWLSIVTLEGTQELMKQREVAVILATGGMGLVRAAYSAGKPAYGVGPGNAPCYIEQSADLAKAASDIVLGKSFDNGVLCSSPNSVVVDAAVDGEVRRQFEAAGGVFLNRRRRLMQLAKMLVTPQRLPNPALVGKSATFIAEKIGVQVPAGTRVLLAELKGVGRDYPLSIEKLCPVLSYYVVKDWREGCERCKQILRYGGMGHTMSIHSRNEQVILEFGLHKPAYRICVNTPSTLGAIGLTTGLDPAMTLGCGGFGGNITSDNISPRHLLNIKRLAYEIRCTVGCTQVHRVPVQWCKRCRCDGCRCDGCRHRRNVIANTAASAASPGKARTRADFGRHADATNRCVPRIARHRRHRGTCRTGRTRLAPRRTSCTRAPHCT